MVLDNEESRILDFGLTWTLQGRTPSRCSGQDEAAHRRWNLNGEKPTYGPYSFAVREVVLDIVHLNNFGRLVSH